jgi:hypothetical protein
MIKGGRDRDKCLYTDPSEGPDSLGVKFTFIVKCYVLAL